MSQDWLNLFLIKETMDDIDKNGDGKVNIEEYIGRSLTSHPASCVL